MSDLDLLLLPEVYAELIYGRLGPLCHMLLGVISILLPMHSQHEFFFAFYRDDHSRMIIAKCASHALCTVA